MLHSWPALGMLLGPWDNLGRSRDALGAVLGAPWDALGTLLDALGALLGCFWALLGCFLTPQRDLGSNLEPPSADFRTSGGRFGSFQASILSSHQRARQQRDYPGTSRALGNNDASPPAARCLQFWSLAGFLEASGKILRCMRYVFFLLC